MYYLLGHRTSYCRQELKMLERAVKDATEKAQIMAKAAGCKLGNVIDIQYGYHDIHVYSEARNIHSNSEAMACDSNSLDISPDDLAMSDKVKVVWELVNVLIKKFMEKIPAKVIDYAKNLGL